MEMRESPMEDKTEGEKNKQFPKKNEEESGNRHMRSCTCRKAQYFQAIHSESLYLNSLLPLETHMIPVNYSL